MNKRMTEEDYKYYKRALRDGKATKTRVGETLKLLNISSGTASYINRSDDIEGYHALTREASATNKLRKNAVVTAKTSLEEPIAPKTLTERDVAVIVDRKLAELKGWMRKEFSSELLDKIAQTSVNNSHTPITSNRRWLARKV
jgi:hypothetical protein